jgi:hypothetical protein
VGHSPAALVGAGAGGAGRGRLRALAGRLQHGAARVPR